MTCLVYVDTRATTAEIATELAHLLGVEHQPGSAPWVLDTPNFYLSVRTNELADSDAAQRFPDGFVNFPAYVEVTGSDDGEEGEIRTAEVAASILHLFWGRGIPAVAECAYDERLPFGGGYGRSEVPWPAAPQDAPD